MGRDRKHFTTTRCKFLLVYEHLEAFFLMLYLFCPGASSVNSNKLLVRENYDKELFFCSMNVALKGKLVCVCEGATPAILNCSGIIF